uniref:SWIM-type domain-containing protein n=1 Tax=Setaria italica TaxID=4555 RepID=K3ZNJ8_SETIT
MEAEGYVSLEETKEYKCIVDQTFMREEDFYEFYNDYAYHKGFSIRKGRVRYKTGTKEVIWRRLMCSCEGYRSVKYFERMDQKRQPRALTRCGCTARLDVEWSEIIGTWYVKDFVDVHTHALAKPEHVFVLRSHRGLNDPQKVEVVELGLGGLRPFQIMDVMEASHGGPWETGFLSQDLYNFFSRYKKGKVEGSDVEFVLNHMRQMQEKDPEFFFTFSVDAQGRLKNLFWSDAQSQIDYGVFGDVVVFDSTYRVNRYNLPFVPFIGVNHHRSTVVFGCGILSDETILSYVWLLEALLEAMHQKHPKSLITDGDAAMMRAIEIVMPDADHRLCSWHIEQNMLKRFRGLKLKDFRKFIYHAMEEGEFDRLWREFRGTHNIKEDNLWMSLVDLMEHYEFCLSRIRRNEIELDARALCSIPFTKISADVLEKSATQIFTPTIFQKVSFQIKKSSNWSVTEVTLQNGCLRYEVSLQGNNKRSFHVTCTFGSSLVDARCHCRKLEREGIPCAHTFCVMKYSHIESIPPCCVYVRWTMNVKSAFPTEMRTNTHVWTEQMDRYHSLRSKGNRALFKVSRSQDETDRVMKLLDDILKEDTQEQGMEEETTFGPLPAHFSAANQPGGTKVLDPVKIVSKGAPRSNK